jgi:hypothetical protein
MDFLFTLLDFFTTGLGTLLTVVLVGLIVLLRDWRLSLAGLVLVQASVASSLVNVHGVSAEWAGLQIAVAALCALILAISAYQVRLNRLTRLPGALWLRLMALLVVAFTWWMLDLPLTLPKVEPQLSQVLAWIALSALLLLGLNDSPFFTGVALLLWCIPAHAMTAILLVNPSLTVAIGVVELLIALACSYLILVDRGPVSVAVPTLTDVTFPEAGLPAPQPLQRSPATGARRRTAPFVPARGKRALTMEKRP